MFITTVLGALIWRMLGRAGSLFFSLRSLPQVPHIPSAYVPQFVLEEVAEMPDDPLTGQPASYSSRYMQHLGVCLWQWLFSGPIKSSFERSQGIAIGQDSTPTAAARNS